MKIFKQLLVSLGVMAVVLTATALPVMAADTGFLTLPDKSSYGEIPGGKAGATGQQQVYDLVIAVVNNVRYIIGAVAIGMIVYAGVRMVIAQGKEDEYATQKRNILWAIIGLALIGFSGEIVRIFSVYCEGGKDAAGNACVAGGFLKDPNAIIRQSSIFNQQTQFIITFIRYIVGSICVLMIIRNGLRMITMGSQDDKMEMDKKNLFYSIFGLILIIISDTVINKVIFKLDPSKYSGLTGATPTSDPVRAVQEIVGVTNLVLNILSPVAVLFLLYGAFLYVTSAGNEEQQGKAKRVIFMAIVGIIVMYGAFAIVSTIISGQFDGAGIGPVTQ